MLYCLKKKLKHIFWKSFKMNKYKINPIHVKEKEQTVLANYVYGFSMQNHETHTPSLNGIVFLVTGKFFSRNQMKTRQENVDF